MNIAIVGAGAAGVLTAWELAADGHCVTVFERRNAALEEAGFGHAGLVAPACAALGLGTEAPPPQRWSLWPSDRRWASDEKAALRRRRAALQQAGLANDPRFALARFGRGRLLEMAAALELHWQRSEGVLVLMRSDKERRRMAPRWAALREAGVAVEECDAATLQALEPGLHTGDRALSAVRLPEDEAGNCRLFALQLRGLAQERGVHFQFGTAVLRIAAAQRPSLEIRREGVAGSAAFDAVVVCAGSDTPALLRPLGLRLPWMQVHGYSVSAPTGEPLFAPRSAVVDSRSAAAITRFGDRVRVAGAAHRGAASQALRESAIRSLYRALHSTFPGAARMSAGVQEWHGVRLALPDGLPLLGRAGPAGVWLNVGHGTHGWSYAAGAARLLANAIAEPTPPPALDAFGIDRLR